MALLAFPLVHLLSAHGAREGRYYGYFDFPDDRNLVEGNDGPLGNSRLTPEQKRMDLAQGNKTKGHPFPA